MNTTIEFQKLPGKKQIIVKHSYPNALETIWKAFTTTEMLEKFWAPEPYKAIVIFNDFKKGGKLFYYMLSPKGEEHYCIDEFLDIDHLKSYEVLDAFCDENGVINTALPSMKWSNHFTSENGITTVINTISFEKTADMTKNLEMGFEEGYKMSLNQLYALLNKK